MDVRLTAKELIATLEKTHLPTILVEGVDDMRRYRWIEGAIPGGVSVMQTGGRNLLFEIYQARERFQSPVVFVADRDLMIFGSVPKEYRDIVFTTGFSIENDLMSGECIEALLKDDISVCDLLLNSVCCWYAFEIQNYLDGREYRLDYKLGEIVDLTTFAFKPTSVNPRQYSRAPIQLEQQIRRNYKLLLRGKNLLSLYAYVFQKRDSRNGTHIPQEMIIEICAKVDKLSLTGILVENIMKAFERQGYDIRNVKSQ